MKSLKSGVLRILTLSTLMIIRSIIIILLGCVSGCSFFVEPKVTYVIANKSSHTIAVRTFISSELKEEVILPTNDEYKHLIDVKTESDLQKLSELEKMVLDIFDKSDRLEANKSAKVQSWQAVGQIRVWDERLPLNVNSGSFIPVEGCEVRANRWFTTKTDLTDDLGWFSIAHSWPNKPVNYSIKWEREDFNIKDGPISQAFYNGPKQQAPWFLTITEASSPKSYAFAHIHRGAHEYYYNASSYGIDAPPTKQYFSTIGILGLIGSKMSLGLLTTTGVGSSHYFHLYNSFGAAEIGLSFDLSGVDDARSIFATTVHELAHASHWRLGFTNANYLASANSRKLAESWAQAVGWYVTRNVYQVPPPYTISPTQEQDHLQLTNLGDIQQSNYTPLFIDLIDGYNQSVNGAGRPVDLASYYSLGQLEDILDIKPTNWTNYRNYLRDNTSNPTETHALNLFDLYDKP